MLATFQIAELQAIQANLRESAQSGEIRCGLMLRVGITDWAEDCVPRSTATPQPTAHCPRFGVCPVDGPDKPWSAEHCFLLAADATAQDDSEDGSDNPKQPPRHWWDCPRGPRGPADAAKRSAEGEGGESCWQTDFEDYWGGCHYRILVPTCNILDIPHSAVTGPVCWFLFGTADKAVVTRCFENIVQMGRLLGRGFFGPDYPAFWPLLLFHLAWERPSLMAYGTEGLIFPPDGSCWMRESPLNSDKGLGRWQRGDVKKLPAGRHFLLIDCDVRAASACAVGVLLPAAPPTHHSSKVSSKKQSWTQPELNTAITAEIKKYSEALASARNRSEGAHQALRKVLGRNALARRLGVKAAKMIGDSPVWRRLADEFGMGRKSGGAAVSRPTKIGLDVAEEKAAEAAGDTTKAEVLRRETLAMINKAMKTAKPQVREALKTLADELVRGQRDDEDARATLTLYTDQQQDDRSRKVSGNL
jgi:hypothetical protein